MRLYEYEAKKLLKHQGIAVPEGILITRDTIGRVAQAAYPVAIKAQVFLGSRGKAGLVQFADTPQHAEAITRDMIGKKHGPYTVEKVLVEHQVRSTKELYLAATIDRLEHKPLVMISRKGGAEIEEIARQDPDSILKYYFTIREKLHGFQTRMIASELNFSSSDLNVAAAVVGKLYELFLDFDCKLVEVNPLVVTDKQEILALDAKVDLDEDAMFRHPVLSELGIHARHEVGELTVREQHAKDKGIPYVDLDGDIGVFPGGAGFGIAAIDLITHYGGKPANFMDSGGAPTQDKLRAMLGLLIDNPRVKAIFGARFGGISRCDDWAKALVEYVKANKPTKPMIMRMAGNMEEEGRKVLEQAKQDDPELFKHIKVYAVNTPIEDVIKETIKAAQSKGSGHGDHH